LTITDEAKKSLLSIRPCLAIARVITEYAEVAGLDMKASDGSMRIDNEPFERLCIEKIDTNVISVAHYFEQNGDLVPDPDMVFFILDSYWYPVSFQNQLTYQECMEYDNDGQILAVLENIRSMISFTDTWADIISSQGYLEAVKPIGNEDAE